MAEIFNFLPISRILKLRARSKIAINLGLAHPNNRSKRTDNWIELFGRWVKCYSLTIKNSALNIHSGCSAVRLAHLLWEQGAAGSNPATPTSVQRSLMIISGLFVFQGETMLAWVRHEMQKGKPVGVAFVQLQRLTFRIMSVIRGNALWGIWHLCGEGKRSVTCSW